jgi:hypothetical protein
MVEEKKNNSSSEGITRGWALLAMLCLSPIFFLSIYLGHLKEGVGAWICTGIVLVTARTRWDLRGHAGYWAVVIFALLIQIPFVLFVPWDNRHLSFVSLLPVGILDYVIVYGSFKLLEKLMNQNGGVG